MKKTNIPIYKKLIFLFKNIYDSQLMKRFILACFKIRAFKGISKQMCILLGRKPAKVMLGVTYKCQCSCRHCGVSNYKKMEQEFTKEEVFNLIDEIYRMNINRIYFFGGEPLIRKDISELIEYASQKGIITELDTNGHLLDTELAKKLKRAGLDIIRVSLDSPIAEEHNKFRNCKNLFQRAVNGIKASVKEGIETHISTCAIKELINSNKLENMISLADRLGAKLRFLKPTLSGKYISSTEQLLNESEKERLFSYLKSNKIYLEMDIFDIPGNPAYCNAILKKLVYISCYGEIQPCCYMPFSFGNVRQEPLKNILKRMWSHEIFKYPGLLCPMNNTNFRKKYLQPVTNMSMPISLK